MTVEFDGWRVPPDFISDGCTMAPDFWPTPEGMVDLREACLLHDFLRRYGIVKTGHADRILRYHLIHIGAPKYMAWLYWAVVKIARPFFKHIHPLPEKWKEYKARVEK